MKNVSPEALVEELHAAVKRQSSVPKVAAQIGMNYHSLRDNLLGNTQMRLITVDRMLDALEMSWEELLERARLSEAHRKF
ncbi:hypothetical protein [Microbacterium sp. R86528]|uniref:hypothetical protein n=1 Tax=Microbacterium sp. R86528 TaxID=3093864 RepID=UPI0037CAA679